MKNLITCFLAKHCASLAQITARFGSEIKKHRTRLAHLVWVVGLFGMGFTLLSAFFGDGMDFPLGMLKVLIGICLICWGAYYSDKWEDDDLEDFYNEQARKEAVREAKRKLKSMGKIHLN